MVASKKQLEQTPVFLYIKNNGGSTNMINDFIQLICSELDITTPQIITDNAQFATGTTMAFYDGEKIHIKKAIYNYTENELI